MDATQGLLLHLLDAAAHDRAPDASVAEGADWAAVFELARAHRLDALMLDVVCALPTPLRPDDALLGVWQQLAMETIFAQAGLVDQLHALLFAFEAGGVRAVVMKGVALKALYPQPDLRTMSDADLLVSEADFEAALRILSEQGFRDAGEEPGVRMFQGQDGLHVELHARLFDQKAQGFLSRLDEQALFPVTCARREAVYGGEAWVFPPERHALFMLCHMAKHMLVTGFGLRQAMDFSLFAEKTPNVDWAWFREQAEALGLLNFAGAMCTLGARYFSLPEAACPCQSDNAAADALLQDLLDAGVFGKTSRERERSAAVVYRAFDEADGDRGRVRRALFPSAGSLKAPYLYAQRHPALLPFAWAHRWLNFLLGLLTGRNTRGEAAGGMKVADERLRLLDKLGLRQ